MSQENRSLLLIVFVSKMHNSAGFFLLFRLYAATVVVVVVMVVVALVVVVVAVVIIGVATGALSTCRAGLPKPSATEAGLLARGNTNAGQASCTGLIISFPFSFCVPP